MRGKGDYASKSIFLPATGNGYAANLKNVGYFGSYWSSTPNTDRDSYAYDLFFGSSRFYLYESDYRSSGRVVRPLRTSDK